MEEKNINENTILDFTNSNNVDGKVEYKENIGGEMNNQEKIKNEQTVSEIKNVAHLTKNENNQSNKKFNLIFKIMDIASFTFLILATILAFISAFSSNSSYFFIAIILCTLSSFLIGVLLAFQLFEIFRKDTPIKNITKSEKIIVIIKFILVLIILCFMAFMLVYITKLSNK